MKASIARLLTMGTTKLESSLRYCNPTKLVPPYDPGQNFKPFHKGDHGRVLVVGGCEDYSGAPAMAALAAARTGADMCHVLCSRDVSHVIKTYNPNIMVHGYLKEDEEQALPQKAVDILDRMHVVLIGCGLGRNPILLKQVAELIKEVHKRGLPLVIDADGLHLVGQDLSLIKTGDVTLTPNFVEFSRLCKPVTGTDVMEIQDTAELAKEVEAFCQAIGNPECTVLLKNSTDIITNNGCTEYCDTQGSKRRTSGQGDILSGCVAAFTAWRVAYSKHKWDTEPIVSKSSAGIQNDQAARIAAPAGASEVVRLASHLAFEKKQRAVMANDVLDEIGDAFELFLNFNHA